MNQKMMQKAKEAKTADELQAAAKEFGMEFTEEQAKVYFDRLHAEGEVADEELSSVVGGGCNGDPPRESEKGLTCPSCGGKLKWEYGANWTTAQCKKCKRFYAYVWGCFIEVDINQ